MKSKFQPVPRERGQSMVELAISITFLMVLLAGTIDLGHAFFVWQEMRDAAQEGASYGSICPNKGGAVITRTRANLVNSSAYTVDFDAPSTAVGQPITITIETDLPINMPFLGTILGSNSIHITATINDSILNSTCPTP
jgi:Flp pilus assembly protein TadG